MTERKRRAVDAIRSRRKELGMTQARFAVACGLDPDRFRRIETGRQEPSASDLAALTRLGVNAMAVIAEAARSKYGMA